MPQPRLTPPRKRLAYLVGWSLLTLVIGTAVGFAIWRATDSDFNLESPEQARSMDATQEMLTIVPTSRVIRLTPVALIATTAVPTETALTPTREQTSSRLSAPQITVTPSAQAPELVTNGDFEVGDSSWYVEGGAGPITGESLDDGSTVLLLPATGGYADQIVAVAPGETYELRGSGRITSAGDTGLLGVVYRDGSGNRLRDLEPPPISFTETQFVEKLLVFTVPPEISAVYVYAYKEPGSAQFEIDGISVRSTEHP